MSRMGRLDWRCRWVHGNVKQSRSFVATCAIPTSLELQAGEDVGREQVLKLTRTILQLVKRAVQNCVAL